jgi:hypothetical protein
MNEETKQRLLEQHEERGRFRQVLERLNFARAVRLSETFRQMRER